MGNIIKWHEYHIVTGFLTGEPGRPHVCVCVKLTGTYEVHPGSQWQATGSQTNASHFKLYL